MNKNLIWLLPILFLMTVEYRIDLGPLSVAIVEPFVLLAALIVLLPKLIRREAIEWRNPVFLLFAGITAWAMIIRPFSPDWKHGLSDIRDWLVPTVFVLTLLNTTPRRLDTWSTAFVGVLLFNSLFGIFQHFVDGFRFFTNPLGIFKSTLDGSDSAAFGVAFFDAPNGFGLYLAVATPFFYGWLRTHLQRYGYLRYLLLLIPFLALYYSYSRTSLLVVGAIILFLALEALIRSTPRFIQLSSLFLGIGAALVAVGLYLLPHVLLRTIWWRIALWEIAGITLRDNNMVWLFGNGVDRFIPLSFYPQPHNLFVFMLLEYGIVGLLFTFAIIGWLLSTGLQARREDYFKSFPQIAPMWIGTLGIFAIALTETTWISLNARLLFAIITTFYCMTLAQASPALVQLHRWRLPGFAIRAPNLSREQHP